MTEAKVSAALLGGMFLSGLVASIVGARFEDGCVYFTLEGEDVPDVPLVRIEASVRHIDVKLVPL